VVLSGCMRSRVFVFVMVSVQVLKEHDLLGLMSKTAAATLLLQYDISGSGRLNYQVRYQTVTFTYTYTHTHTHTHRDTHTHTE
jgi:hypothetical protein